MSRILSVAAIIVLLTGVQLSPAEAVSLPVPTLETASCEVPRSGQWVLAWGDSVVCRDVTLVAKNVTIYPGAKLLLERSELIIDAGIDSDGGVNHWENAIRLSGIYPVGAGMAGPFLEVYDSIIRAKDPQLRPGGIIQGESSTIIMHRSEVRDFRTVVVAAYSVEKLEIKDSKLHATQEAISSHYSRNVWLENNLFYGPGDGVLIHGQSGTIRGNTFVGCNAAIYLRNEDAGIDDFSQNTISNCGAGLSSNVCTYQSIHDNDIYRNLNKHGNPRSGTSENALCGDQSMNWWGQEHPDPKRIVRPTNIYPTRAEPVHPERLPDARIHVADTDVRRNRMILLSAEDSRPSETWGATLEKFEWDFGDGKTQTGAKTLHRFHQRGHYEVQLRVTDELGLSRTTTTTIHVW